MKTPIILCFLLAYAACAQSGHFQDEGFSETEEDKALQTDAKGTQKIPGICFICKLILRKVKASMGNQSKEEIERKLHNVCNWMFFLKGPCRNLVSKYIMQLVHELQTSDTAATACRNIGLCRSRPLHWRK